MSALRFEFPWSVVLGVGVVDRIHGTYGEAFHHARFIYGQGVRLVYGPSETTAARFNQPSRRRRGPRPAPAARAAGTISVGRACWH
jgi:hypothetical protein